MFRYIGKSKIAIILAFLFMASLFFFRQGSSVSNILNSDNIVAKVSETPISTSKFNRTLQINIQRFNEILGKSLTSKEIRDFQIPSLALNALINDSLFENQFDQIGFRLDDTIIAQKTKDTLPQLYDQNNKLNQQYLNEFLSQQLLKIEDIVQIVNYETRNEFFNDAFLKLNYPKSFNSQIKTYEEHKRVVDFLNFSLDKIDIEKKDTESDQKIKDYYKINIKNYMTEESRNIDYIIIDKKDYLINFKPTDFESREYFDNNLNLFKIEETRSFIQFNFKNLEDAKNFKESISNINTIDNILKFANDKNIKFNKFTDLQKNQLNDEISNVLFNLKVNEKSKIIESILAKHLLILENIKPAKQLNFNEVSEEIKTKISEIETNNFISEMEANITKDILGGINLYELKAKYNLKINSLENLKSKNENNLNIDEKLLNTLINNSFKTKIDFVSDPIKIDTNRMIVFEVKQIFPSIPIEFSKIKKEIYQDWEIEEKKKLILSNIEKNTENTNYLNVLKNKYNANIKNVEINKNNNSLPKNLIREVFEKETNKINILFDNNQIYIYLIKDINLDNILIEDILEISLQEDIRNTLKNEFYSNAKIITNDRLIDAIINNY